MNEIKINEIKSLQRIWYLGTVAYSIHVNAITVLL